MEAGSEAYKIEFLIGQVHALKSFLQTIAIEHPNPVQLAVSAARMAEVGLAKIESSPVADAAVTGYQWTINELLKAIPSGGE